MNARRFLIAAAAPLAVLAVAIPAGARSSEPAISPEYTWPVSVAAVLEQTHPAPPPAPAPVAVAVDVHARAAVDVEAVAAGTPNVLHEMTDPIHYTGPSVESAVPGGWSVITDHAVSMPADPRVLRCLGGGSFGEGGTFPAASIAQPGLADTLIAQGVCRVVG